ncbi:MAG: glycosyltransferase family 2 protein [Infirmifilum sp.]
MSETPRVSVVIVTYNAGKYVIPSLRSVLASHGAVVDEVIVVDNSSSDDTMSLVEKHFGRDLKVRVVRLRRNFGFPLACNIGVDSAKNRFVVCMNPDVVVEPDCFAKLVEAILGDESIAVVQPKILHPGGYIDSAGGVMDVLGHGFHIGKFERDHGQYDEPRDILYASFACAMVRRDVYLKLGGMDPRYFLYNEDLDFCWRSWLAGYRVVYVPNAIAYHVGQHATRRLPYHALYFGRRNRLYTIFTNYPLPLAITASLLLLGFYVGLGMLSIMRDRVEARLTLRIMSRFFRDLGYLTMKRTGLARRRGFFEIARRGLVSFKLMGLRLYLVKLYRRQLGLE